MTNPPLAEEQDTLPIKSLVSRREVKSKQPAAALRRVFLLLPFTSRRALLSGTSDSNEPGVVPVSTDLVCVPSPDTFPGNRTLRRSSLWRFFFLLPLCRLHCTGIGVSSVSAGRSRPSGSVAVGFSHRVRCPSFPLTFLLPPLALPLLMHVYLSLPLFPREQRRTPPSHLLSLRCSPLALKALVHSQPRTLPRALSPPHRL